MNFIIYCTLSSFTFFLLSFAYYVNKKLSKFKSDRDLDIKDQVIINSKLSMKCIQSEMKVSGAEMDIADLYRKVNLIESYIHETEEELK